MSDCPGFEAEAIFYDCGGSLWRRANQASGPAPKWSSSWELGSWGKEKPGDTHGETIWGVFFTRGEKRAVKGVRWDSGISLGLRLLVAGEAAWRFGEAVYSLSWIVLVE